MKQYIDYAALFKSPCIDGFDAETGGLGGTPLNGDYHGTLCAGIIGAVKDNEAGIAGIAPKCKLMRIRVNFQSYQSSQALADGINWAWQNGADVISNSWGGGTPYQAIDEAILMAALLGRDEKGCVVVFASGNSGSSAVDYPAGGISLIRDIVIAVGATDRYDHRTYYSSYGDALDVVAPGDEITTTDAIGSGGISPGDYTGFFSGTSAACPHVSGIAALILSINPCLTADDVASIIKLSADKVGGVCYSTTNPNGSWNTQMGHGRVNAYKAVQFANSPSIIPFTNVSGTDYTSNFLYQWIVQGGGCLNIQSATYNLVKRHEIRASITYPWVDNPIILGNSNGLSMDSPNNGNDWFSVVNIDETSATLKTYVYELINSGQTIGWIPRPPSEVRMNLTVLNGFKTKNYLQNRTIVNSENQSAINTIEAGTQVTNEIPFGDLIIETGNVTFKAGTTITLKPGFHAKNGSTFRAYLGKLFNVCTFNGGRMISESNPEFNLKYKTNYSAEPPENNPSESELTVFPNPIANEFTIQYKLAASDYVTISIYNIKGIEIVRFQSNESLSPGSCSIDIDATNFSSGEYLIRFQNTKNTSTKKIIKR